MRQVNLNNEVEANAFFNVLQNEGTVEQAESCALRRREQQEQAQNVQEFIPIWRKFLKGSAFEVSDQGAITDRWGNIFASIPSDCLPESKEGALSFCESVSATE